jgi:hypothetical protein
VSDCKRVRDALPEYVTGIPLPDRDRIAGHLSYCVECDEARRETEAVFALLEALPEAPVTPHAEANARLALHTAIAPGPLRALEADRRRENLRLAICSFVSFSGTAAAAVGIINLSNAKVTPEAALQWAERSGAKLLPSIAPWQGLVAFLLIGGLAAALLPALILRSPLSSRSRRMRREV